MGMLGISVYMGIQHLMLIAYNVAKDDFNLQINLLARYVKYGKMSNAMLGINVYMGIRHLIQHVYNAVKGNFNLQINLMVQVVQIGRNAIILNTFHLVAIVHRIV